MLPDRSDSEPGIAGHGPSPRVICEDYAGHEWAPAGGGMLICMRCEAEAWEDEVSADAT